MLRYKTIDLKKDERIVTSFRKDSFAISFNETSGFEKAGYVQWLAGKIKEFPDGFVMVDEGSDPIGQLELSIREYEGRHIGYVHLYYLKSEYRRRGLGNEIHQYALQSFRDHDVPEYHLRVSPNNVQAKRFYEKNGMIEIGPEIGDKVVRMKGEVER
ncbi:GNAT family N-acetyltransferase [Bacillus salacetis]|uniref:GNAT family N-acetyltransferase n=1 Tax=Bacillus salacetis TaxID=2315464 RepID=A0A3A1QNY4_9BACI|nr:GNAT family N-acetyltransferase [Bacillus salacetis]RIW28746.1 GNAT family N-acetyltransferase [Bacillus salacetis]